LPYFSLYVLLEAIGVIFKKEFQKQLILFYFLEYWELWQQYLQESRPKRHGLNISISIGRS